MIRNPALLTAAPDYECARKGETITVEFTAVDESPIADARLVFQTPPADDELMSWTVDLESYTFSWTVPNVATDWYTLNAGATDAADHVKNSAHTVWARKLTRRMRRLYRPSSSMKRTGLATR